MKILPVLLTAAVFAVVADAAAARAIYRCGPDGKTFSHAPCAEGSVVESSDPRSAAQRAEAKKVLEREREREATAERVRRQAAERSAAASAAAAADPPAPAAATTVGTGSKPGDAGVIAVSQPLNRANARP